MGNKMVIWKQNTFLHFFTVNYTGQWPKLFLNNVLSKKEKTEVFSSGLRKDHTHCAKAHNAQKC